MKHSERERLVDRLISHAFFLALPRKPGAVIASLPAQVREKLKELVSKDFYHRIK